MNTTLKTKLNLLVSRKSVLAVALAAGSALTLLPCGQALALNPQPLPPGFALHALNPQPLPPGRALNPQPLPPGLYAPYHSGPLGGQFSHGGHIPK